MDLETLKKHPSLKGFTDEEITEVFKDVTGRDLKDEKEKDEEKINTEIDAMLKELMPSKLPASNTNKTPEGIEIDQLMKDIFKL